MPPRDKRLNYLLVNFIKQADEDSDHQRAASHPMVFTLPAEECCSDAVLHLPSTLTIDCFALCGFRILQF